MRQARKPSTLIAFESIVRFHLVPFFGERSVQSITHHDVADLVAVMEARGLAPKSVHNYIGTLSALFNFAAAPRRGWATSNPCRGAELPAIPECAEMLPDNSDAKARLLQGLLRRSLET